MGHRWCVIDPPAEHKGGLLDRYDIGLMDAEQLVASDPALFRNGGPADPRLDASLLTTSCGEGPTPAEIETALVASGRTPAAKPATASEAEPAARGTMDAWLQYAAWHGGSSASEPSTQPPGPHTLG